MILEYGIPNSVNIPARDVDLSLNLTTPQFVLNFELIIFNLDLSDKLLCPYLFLLSLNLVVGGFFLLLFLLFFIF
jgi:hypothetical protein